MKNYEIVTNTNRGKFMEAHHVTIAYVSAKSKKEAVKKYLAVIRPPYKENPDVVCNSFAAVGVSHAEAGFYDSKRVKAVLTR